MGRNKNPSRHVVQDEPEAPQPQKEEYAEPIQPAKAQGSFRPPQDTRLRKKYQVPPSARVRHTDPHWLIIRELTAEEMNDASKIAQTNSAKASQEVSKLALEAICRDPSGDSAWETINHAAAQHEIVWGQLSQKVRTLIAQGTKDVNVTSDEEDTYFLNSGEVL